MPEVTVNGALAGFLQPYTGLRIWEAESTYTEQDAYPGRPDPAARSDMRLDAGGDPDATTTIELVCHRGGNSNSAKFLYRSGSTGDFLGFDGQGGPTRAEGLSFSSTTAGRHNAQILPLADGRVVVVCDNTDVSARTRSLQVAIRAADGTLGAWSTILSRTYAATGDEPPLQSLCYNPVVMLSYDQAAWEIFYLDYTLYDELEPTDGHFIQLGRIRSTDEGTTWTVVATDCLDSRAVAPADAYTTGLSIARVNRTWMAVINYGPGEAVQPRQYVSTQDGYEFTLVGSLEHDTATTSLPMGYCTVTFTGTYFQIAAMGPNRLGTDGSGTHYQIPVSPTAWFDGGHDAGDFVSYLSQVYRATVAVVLGDPNPADPSNTKWEQIYRAKGPYVGRTGNPAKMPSAWEAVLHHELMNQATDDIGLERAQIVRHSDRTLWLYFTLPVDGEGAAWACKSDDQGFTWEGIFSSASGEAGLAKPLKNSKTYYPIRWWWAGGGSRPVMWTAQEHQGRVVVVYNPETPDDSTYQFSLGLLQLGGGSTVTRPRGINSDALLQSGWRHTYLPHAALEDGADWSTDHFVGAPTQTPSLGRIRIEAVSGGRAEWRNNTGSSTSAVTAIGNVCVEVESGHFEHRIHVSPNGGTTDYAAALRITDTDVLLRDIQSGSTLATAAHGVTGPVEVIWGVDGPTSSASVWYRGLDAESKAGTQKEWTNLIEDASLTAFAGTVYQEEIVVSDDAYIHWIFSNAGPKSALETPRSVTVDVDNVISPGLGEGQAQADRQGLTIGHNAYLTEGVYVRGSGTAHGGEEWDIPIEASYSADKALPNKSASPRVGWRSTVASGEHIAFEFGTSEEDQGLGSEVLGLYLEDVSFPRVEVSLYKDGAWEAADTIDLRLFSGVSYTREGDAVRPSGAGDITRYIRHGELTGGVLDLGSNVVRVIGGNTGGAADGQGDVQAVSITMSDFDGTEPASGTMSASATKVLILYHLRGDRAIRGVRLKPLDSKGNIRIGTFACGPVHILGNRPDPTRTRVYEVGNEIVENPDGTTYEVARPDGGRVEISWTRLIRGYHQQDDTNGFGQVFGSSKASSEPYTSRHSTPWTLRGFVEEQQRAPVVFCPYIPQDDGAGGLDYDVLVGEQGGAFYGRIASQTQRIETARGAAETACELVRVPTITLERIT